VEATVWRDVIRAGNISHVIMLRNIPFHSISKQRDDVLFY